MLDHDELQLEGGTSRADLLREIASRRKPKAKKRKKSDEKPEGYKTRRPGASVGRKVSFLKERFFRAERRLRRRAPQIAGRNVYVTTYVKLGEGAEAGRRIKLATVSHPPGGLPKNEASLSEPVLAALTKPDHSEAITDRTEENWPMLTGFDRVNERTSREQCKDCRVKYPSKSGADHSYGFPYSAPVDHIHDNDLHEKILANDGKISGLKVSAGEKAHFAQARDSATWERQHGAEQNPALNQTIKTLGSEDSEESYSDDEDSIYLDPYLRQQLPGLEKPGKAPLRDIPPEFTMSPEATLNQLAWIKEKRAEKKTAKASGTKAKKSGTRAKKRRRKGAK